MKPAVMIVAVATSIAAASASEAGKRIFSDRTCEVISADISPKVTLDVLRNWPEGAVAGVSFLYYDGRYLQILLEDDLMDSADISPTLSPIRGYSIFDGESLEEVISYITELYYPLDKVDHLQLLNAFYDTESLKATYAVFISDKRPFLMTSFRWYQIRGTQLFSENGFIKIPSNRLSSFTREILLSIQHFVKCPNEPKQAAPVLPDPIVFKEQTDQDLREQREFYSQHKCMVDGSEIIFGDSIDKSNVVTQCRPALMEEVKRVCGKELYHSKDPRKTRCLIHGTYIEYEWKIPRRSPILGTEPELWTVALVSDFEDDFQFEWAFHDAWPEFLNHPQFIPGMIMIFTIDNPDECEYQLQFGDDNLKPDIDPSKAVIRYDFSSFTYPTIDQSKVPDSWIYPSWAANECGLRLLSEYSIRSKSVPKLTQDVPIECSIKPDWHNSWFSMEQVNRYEHGLSLEGAGRIQVCAVPLHWDGRTLWMGLSHNVQSFCVDSDKDVILVGTSLAFTAARILRKHGDKVILGEVRAKDMRLLSVTTQIAPDVPSVYFGVFSSTKVSTVRWIPNMSVARFLVPSEVISSVTCVSDSPLLDGRSESFDWGIAESDHEMTQREIDSDDTMVG